MNSKYTLPNGDLAELIKTTDGYNWKVLNGKEGK